MKTTNFFIELLVIGIGAVACLILASITFFEFETNSLHELNKAAFIFPFTALTYVLGIVFDRVFDALTEKIDKKIRKDILSEESYDWIRSIGYDNSAAVRQVFDYTKSRIRISRSWMFYFMILAILILIFSIKTGEYTWLAASLLSLILSFITFFSWKKLTQSFNGTLNRIFIRNKDNLK